VGARYDFDPVGHYSRPDIFSLEVDQRAKKNLRFIED
jgi:nitrilase